MWRWGRLFTTGLLWGRPALYRAMGGTGTALAAAVTYSNIVFADALSFWLLNTLASVIRGTRNMLLPAAVILGGGTFTLLLSPVLIFGWGAVPALGLAEAGVSLFSAIAVALIAYAGIVAGAMKAGAWQTTPTL